MPLIDRAAVCTVALPEAEVEVPAIGGTVLVVGMDMPQMLRFNAARRAALQPREGETPDDAAERASGELVPMLLEMTVLAADRLPVYSAAQWAVFAARHPHATRELFDRALALGGQGDAGAEKKT